VARLQGQRAAQSAERERMVKAFVTDVFRVGSQSRGPGTATQRTAAADDHLQAVAGLIEVRFPAQPDIQAELLGVVGNLFAEMGAFALAAGYAE
jgi:hypothetical protein